MKDMLVFWKDDGRIDVGSRIWMSQKGVAIRLAGLLGRSNISEMDRAAIRAALALVKAFLCPHCDGTGVGRGGILEGHICSCQD
jgi:hypothetical protein